MAAARRHAGFTYLWLLFVLAIGSAGLAAIAQRWSTATQRDKEAELIFRGHEIQRALASYWAASSAHGNALPQRLQDLVEDRRGPETRRHLRRVYTDPFTGQADWQLIMSEPDGGIRGVRSRALAPAMKTVDLVASEAGGRPLVSDRVFAFSVPARAAAGAASGPSEVPAEEPEPGSDPPARNSPSPTKK